MTNTYVAKTIVLQRILAKIEEFKHNYIGQEELKLEMFDDLDYLIAYHSIHKKENNLDLSIETIYFGQNVLHKEEIASRAKTLLDKIADKF